MNTKAKIEEIVIDGETYVPKSSLKTEYKGDLKIVVLQRGWVYVGRYKKEGTEVTIRNAYNIRTYGTTKGLGELVNGVTANTKLDRVEGLVTCHELTVLFTIDLNEEKWKQI